MTAVPAPVQSALDAANSGDTEAFVAAFATDGVVDDWGREFRGHRDIETWTDAEFIGMQVTLQVTGIRQNGDTTVVSTQVGGKGFNGPSDFAFTVEGDLISLMRITG
ncbi:MAG TPA: nuclear transport factor 2 family protein [Nocardioides sp.]|jgi:hypothetical protein